jgi:hypothetical protein
MVVPWKQKAEIKKMANFVYYLGVRIIRAGRRKTPRLVVYVKRYGTGNGFGSEDTGDVQPRRQ